jgi:lipid-binding SYLF domain-containing protein
MKSQTRSVVPFVLVLAGAAAATACGSSQPAMTPAAALSPQQELVNDATSAVRSMRGSSSFKGVDEYLSRAKGVMIFPNLKKGGLIVGGQGGSGVLLARDAKGWSSPAFYSFASGSAGLQIGYQESTVVLVLMSKKSLDRAIEGGVTLGADATVAAGTVGDSAANAATSPGADIVQFIDASGVFAGASLAGGSISPDMKANQAYYSPDATPKGIVLEGRFYRAAAEPLREALAIPR